MVSRAREDPEGRTTAPGGWSTGESGEGASRTGLTGGSSLAIVEVHPELQNVSWLLVPYRKLFLSACQEGILPDSQHQATPAPDQPFAASLQWLVCSGNTFVKTFICHPSAEPVVRLCQASFTILSFPAHHSINRGDPSLPLLSTTWLESPCTSTYSP